MFSSDAVDISDKYIASVDANFRHNMDLILKIIPQTGIRFNILVVSTPEELYQLFSQNDELSQQMMSFVESLSHTDMLCIAVIVDIVVNRGKASGAITNIIRYSDEDTIIYNFILVCIMWLKYYFIPQVILKPANGEEKNKDF